MRTLALVCVLGCGRIGFDALGADDGRGMDATDPIVGPWAKVWAGGHGVCGVKAANGDVWCWGHNDFGQVEPMLSLGAMPVRFGSNWTQLVPQEQFACGVQADHSAWCWGYNVWGNIGDGTMGSKVTPQQVGTTLDWLDVTTGTQHSCGRREDLTAWCWGDGDLGEIGNGDAASPVLVGANVTTISAGGYHTCYVRSDHVLLCTGYNDYGEVGLGNRNVQTAFTQVGAFDWTTVAAGARHTCALKVDGTLWCWGSNRYGQLGIGTTTDSLVPAQVGTSTDWTALALGDDHSCATRSGGALWCWGSTQHGQLGAYDADIPTPTEIDPQHVHGTPKSFALADNLTCYVDAGGVLRCSGSNRYGELDLPLGNSTVPVRGDARTDWMTLAMHDLTACALDTQNHLWCWGRNDYGQLGDGTRRDRDVPTQIGSATWTAVAPGTQLSVGISNHQLYQWGYTEADGQTALSPQLIDARADWDSVAAGDAFACGIRAQTAYCWGLALEAGYNGAGDTVAPNQAVTPGFTRILAGAQHACGDQVGGGLLCWGLGSLGQLGDATMTTHQTPVATTCTPGCPAGALAEFGGGAGHTCFVNVAGNLWCTGDNAAGEFGDGTQASSTRYVVGPSGSWSHLAVGDYHTCGIRSDATLWCWGHGDVGQLGTGVLTSAVPPPTQIGTDTWRQVVAGYHTTAGIRSDGSRWAWGDNEGTYGDGRAWRAAFAAVANDL